MGDSRNNPPSTATFDFQHSVSYAKHLSLVYHFFASTGTYFANRPSIERSFTQGTVSTWLFDRGCNSFFSRRENDYDRQEQMAGEALAILLSSATLFLMQACIGLSPANALMMSLALTQLVLALLTTLVNKPEEAPQPTRPAQI